ncbi:MAG: hypothetical protein GY850_45630 [bacterium]|nr:hypothetical protein [bacterium]
MIICISLLACSSLVFAEGRHDLFMPEETYAFLFSTGFHVVTGNNEFNGRIRRTNKNYTIEPRLKPYTRLRSVEYTAFSFDGYWDRHPWDPMGASVWDRKVKRAYKEDDILGKWHFKVRWTTKTEQHPIMGLVNIIRFEEVIPEVYFIEYGPLEKRHDMLITNRFPDKYHRQRAYADGVFAVFRSPR